MLEVTILSLKDAIARGYVWAVQDAEDQIFKITDLTEVDIEDFKAQQPDTCFWLCDIEPRHYSISEEDLHELIDDHITNQEEFGDEDGVLNDSADEVFEGQKALYTQLCAALNEKLTKMNFYMPSNFQIDFTLP